MNLNAALEDYDYHCRSKNLSQETWRWYEHKLRLFFAWCEANGVSRLDDLRVTHVYRFVDHLKSTPGFDRQHGAPVEQRSTYTVKGYVQVIKGFLKWAEREDYVDPRLRARVDLPRVEQKTIKTLSRVQYNLLTQATANEWQPWYAHRDRAILAVLLDTGMRAAELCGLTVENIHLHGEPYCLVNGKGRKEREVGPLGRESLAAVKRYLNRYRPQVEEPVAFLSRFHKPLSPAGLDQLLYRLEAWAGPEHFAGVRVSAHTFRHTYAVNYLRAGGDIYRLKSLMGHTSIITTQIYLRDYQQKEARKGKSVLDGWT